MPEACVICARPSLDRKCGTCHEMEVNLRRANLKSLVYFYCLARTLMEEKAKIPT